MAVASPPEGAFPLLSLVPKRETGADAFLTKQPNYDGRGVVIAILDTGVDPGAPGLQVTSTGERKIIDCIDASGSGDVCTSHTVTTAATPCDDKIELQGVSRRSLTLCNQWKNPTGVWHVGFKLLGQLFPQSVNNRIQRREEENTFYPEHRQAVANAMLELEKWSTCHPTPNQEEKDFQEELQARIDILNSLTKKYTLPTAAADVVAFHDGDNWWVAIGLDGDGDMRDVEPILPFRISGKFSTFGGDAMVNYTVDVFDDGDIVSIVVAAGAHGTHVAGIAAGCFPDESERNGVAPGAQIVSIKIGDTRLSTMETGTAMVRAAIACVKYNCDLVNLSYGEGSRWNNSGRAIKALADLPKKHGITFVASAGNNGPCLSTVGCPGGTTSGMISVGAYVSPEMMEAQHGLLEKTPGQNYTWSSAGPSTDGMLGVDISAPGGAISSVPSWTLKQHQLMNGTSMSSPNACGCIALILSGLKDNFLQYSPFSIHRALVNTARSVSRAETFVLGRGLLQVGPAYDWLCRYHAAPERDIRFGISCSMSRHTSGRGIYLRDGCASLTQPVPCTVTVTPMYPRDHAKYTESQLALELRLSLVSTETWARTCSHLAVANSARAFQVSVDTRGLEPGAHYAEVQAFDSSDVSRGPLFRVPVTAIVPKQLPDGVHEITETISFDSGVPQRRFIQVPETATYADISLSNATDKVASSRYSVHAVQLEPGLRFSEREFCKTMSPLAEEEKQEAQFSVMGGVVLDVTIAKWWASSKPGTIQLTLKFHSLQSIGAPSTLGSNDGFQKVLVRSGLGGHCILQPQCQLTHSVQVVLPSERKTVLPLGERDRSDSNELNYQLQLTYKFHVGVAGMKSPQFRFLTSVLYESDYHAQLWMLYDSNKAYIGAGDAFADRYSLKLEKGEYTLKLQVRHHTVERLDALKDLQLSVVSKLSSPLCLDVYGSQNELMKGGSKFSSRAVPTAVAVPLFIACPAPDKIPSHVKANSVLEGTLSFSKPLAPALNSKNPVGVDRQPFTFSVRQLSSSTAKSTTPSPPMTSLTPSLALGASTEESTSPANGSSAAKSESDKYQEALRDFNIGWMSKNGDMSQYAELAKAYPDHLPLLSARLTAAYIQLEKSPFTGASTLLAAANKIISTTDVEKVLSDKLRKKDPRPDAASIKSAAEKKRHVYQEALIKKGFALLSLAKTKVPETADGNTQTRDEALAALADDAEEGADVPRSTEEISTQLSAVTLDLQTWFDLWEAKVLPLARAFFAYKGWYGKAIKAALKLADIPTNNMSIKEQGELAKWLDVLEYKHMAGACRRMQHIAYPPTYLPF